METLLESVPQLFIQISFLIFTQTANGTIVFSVVVSTIVILLKVTSDDSALFEERGGGHEFVFNRTETEWLCKDFVFILRYLFRICNVSGNILMYSVIWAFGFGYFAIGQILTQFLLYSFLAIYRKDFRLLANIIFASLLNVYSFLVSIVISVMNIALLIGILVQKKDESLNGLVIYTIFAVAISMVVGGYFFCFFVGEDIDDRYKEANEEGLLTNCDLTGFTSLILFGKGFDKSNTVWISKQDKVRKQNWIHIAMDTNDENTLEFAKYLIGKVKETDEGLIQFKQAMQQKNSIGWTPLENGIKFKRNKALQLFLNSIADKEYWKELLTAKDKYNLTPWSRAEYETKLLFKEIVNIN